jgi:hypothetical protein
MKTSKILFIVGAVLAISCFILNSHEESDYVYGGVGFDISNFLYLKIVTLLVLAFCSLMIILESNDEKQDR